MLYRSILSLVIDQNSEPPSSDRKEMGQVKIVKSPLVLNRGYLYYLGFGCQECYLRWILFVCSSITRKRKRVPHGERILLREFYTSIL